MALGVDVGRGVVEDELHVEGGAPEQQPGRVDERPRGQRPAVGLRARPRDAAEERRPVERAGRGPDDEVEGPREPQALQRRRHPGRHDAAHPAALQDERDAVAVLAPAGQRAGGAARAEDGRDGMGRSGHAGAVCQRPMRERAGTSTTLPGLKFAPGSTPSNSARTIATPAAEMSCSSHCACSVPTAWWWESVAPLSTNACWTARLTTSYSSIGTRLPEGLMANVKYRHAPAW